MGGKVEGTIPGHETHSHNRVPGDTSLTELCWAYQPRKLTLDDELPPLLPLLPPLLPALLPALPPVDEEPTPAAVDELLGAATPPLDEGTGTGVIG